MGATADLVRRFVERYNDGTLNSYGSDAFLDLYAEDVDWAEAPTLLTPQGRRGNREALREAVMSGQQMFRNRRQVIDELIEEGDRAVWLGTWSASIAAEGLRAPVGAKLVLPIATLIAGRGGLIVRQRDYLATPLVS